MLRIYTTLLGLFVLTAAVADNALDHLFEDPAAPERPVPREDLFEVDPFERDRLRMDEELVDREAVVIVAWRFYESGEFRRSSFWFRRALRDADDLPDAAFGLALSLLALEEVEEAEAVAREWLQREPRMGGVLADIHVHRGVEAFGEEDFSAARANLEAAREYRELSAGERRLLGWSLASTGAGELALTLFESLYGQTGEEEDAVALATVLESLGRETELRNFIQRADPAWLPKLNPILGDLVVQRAVRRHEQGHFAASLRDFDEARELRPLARGERVVMAWSLLGAEREAEAIRVFEEAYREEPDPESASGLAAAYRRTGDWRGFEEIALQVGGALRDKIPEVKGPLLRDEGLRLYEEGRFPESAQALEHALGYQTLSGGEELLLAWALYQSNQADRAVPVFRRLMEDGRNADRGEPAYGLSLALVMLQEVAEAERLATEWLRREPRMTSVLADIRVRQAVVALEDEDYARSRDLLEEAASFRFLDRDERLMLGWSYFYADQVRESADLFYELYRSFPGEETAAGAFASLQRLDDRSRLERLIREVGGPIGDIAGPVVGDYFVNRAVQRFQEGDYRWSAEDFQRAADYRELTPEERSAMAWSWFHEGDRSRAARIFEDLYREHPDAGAAEGLVASAIELEDTARVERVAGEVGGPVETELEGLRRSMQLREAGRLFDRGDFQGSIRAYESAASLGPLQRGERMGLAWAYYEAFQLENAVDTFEQLYREQPDQESAEGFYLSAIELGDEARVRRVARQTEGPLNGLLRERDAVRLHGTGMQLMAYRLAPESFPELRDIDGGDVSIAVGGRWKSGERGLSRLRTVEAPVLQARVYPWTLHELGARVSWTTLDSGELRPGQLVGSLPRDGSRAFRFTPTTSVDFSPDGEIWYQYHGLLSPYLHLRLPASDVFSSRLSGRGGLVVHHEAGWIRGSFFSNPVEESILSFVGMIDPYTGQPWGRVSDTGLEFALLQLIDEGRYSAYGNVRAGVLQGEDVQRNEHLRAGGAVGWNPETTGFEFFSIGPAFQFDTYRHNQNFFTRGHGGYFSPDQLFQFLGQIDFLTLRGREWIVRGNVAAGRQFNKTADAPWFPLAPDGRIHEGSTGQNWIYQGWLEGAYLLSPRWTAGMTLHHRKTPTFRYSGGHVFLRFLFGRRAGLFESDLGGHRAGLFESHIGTR